MSFSPNSLHAVAPSFCALPSFLHSAAFLADPRPARDSRDGPIMPLPGAVGLRFQHVEDACKAFILVRELDYQHRLGMECYLMPAGYRPPGAEDPRDRSPPVERGGMDGRDRRVSGRGEEYRGERDGGCGGGRGERDWGGPGGSGGDGRGRGDDSRKRGPPRDDGRPPGGRTRF